MLADFSPVANGSYLIPNLLTSKIFPEFWPCARRERGALSLGLWRERESAHFSGEGRGGEGKDPASAPGPSGQAGAVAKLAGIHSRRSRPRGLRRVDTQGNDDISI